VAQVKNAEVEIGRLGGSYPHAADLSRRLRSVLEELKDIAATLAEDGERIETNPERLQKVDDRSIRSIRFARSTVRPTRAN